MKTKDEIYQNHRGLHKYSSDLGVGEPNESLRFHIFSSRWDTSINNIWVRFLADILFDIMSLLIGNVVDSITYLYSCIIIITSSSISQLFRIDPIVMRKKKNVLKCAMTTRENLTKKTQNKNNMKKKTIYMWDWFSMRGINKALLLLSLVFCFVSWPFISIHKHLLSVGFYCASIKKSRALIVNFGRRFLSRSSSSSRSEEENGEKRKDNVKELIAINDNGVCFFSWIMYSITSRVSRSFADDSFSTKSLNLYGIMLNSCKFFKWT